MNTRSHDPVFVVGSPRSGTSLVVALLTASGAFPIGQVETFLLERYPAEFGNLGYPSNRTRFVEFWLKSKQFQRSGLDPESFRKLAMADGKSYTDFLDVFMASIARKQGKDRWLEKTPSHVFHMRELAECFPSARFIHVVRDGRDVAISKQKIGWVGTRSRNRLVQLIFASKAWALAAKAGREAGAALPGKYLELRYEDIVRDLVRALSDVGSFARVDLDVDVIRNNPVGVLRQSNTHFGDQSGGVESTGVERWKSMLTAGEVRVMEESVGDVLQEFGYELSGPQCSGAGVALKYRCISAYAGVYVEIARLLKNKTPIYHWSHLVRRSY